VNHYEAVKLIVPRLGLLPVHRIEIGRAAAGALMLIVHYYAAVDTLNIFTPPQIVIAAVRSIEKPPQKTGVPAYVIGQ
jgi:hypothetical protein